MKAVPQPFGYKHPFWIYHCHSIDTKQPRVFVPVENEGLCGWVYNGLEDFICGFDPQSIPNLLWAYPWSLIRVTYLLLTGVFIWVSISASPRFSRLKMMYIQ